MIEELDYSQLRRFITRDDIDFATTEDLEASDGIIGQERAAGALSFGLGIKSKGYNIYVAGHPGTGKTTFSKAFAENRARTEPTPPDLCYVYNFENPKTPKTLTVPAGVGKALEADMKELVEKLRDELPRVFSSKDFETRKSDIIHLYQDKRDDVIKGMTEKAKEKNFGVKTTNSGMYFMPIVDGEIISEDQYDALSQEQRDDISKQSEAIQKHAAEAMREIKSFEKETRREVEDMEFSMGLFTVGHLVSALVEKYAPYDKITNYLLAVKEDILENLEEFVEADDEEDDVQTILPWITRRGASEFFTKYYVNLLTDNSGKTGAPVILDFNPTYSNLIGEIEYDNEYGNLTTDFMKIKPGLLHKANGGYLILQAGDLLLNPHAWDALRRALLTEEIVIEPLREYATGYAVSGIKPEPIRVSIKIILVGYGLYYELLREFDDAFQKLFKIRADFDYEMPFTSENLSLTARFIKNFITSENLVQFDYAAVVRVAEYSLRISENKKKLTTRFNKIGEILIEADAWAKEENETFAVERHVLKAVSEQENRFKNYEDKLFEMLEENIILIDTDGAKTGQVNGLAVLDDGEYAFAAPSRITATTYIGKAGIINIEQEAEMSGHIHDKGVQVLTGYIGQTYAQNHPLSLSCRVCFEQSYSLIDGDSASSAELYAILSSLSDLPIRQDMAVTGSVNQRGEIQPIGGVNYKIEGFFDLCVRRGLTGKQGVIIPFQNAQDLALRDRVVENVRDGMFHIYAISGVDDGIQLLTGVEAGKRDANGQYPVGSVHWKAIQKLKDFHNKSSDS
ncbi:MAG: AAA family ATPase [Clostridiales bacterium]|jgi:lon-related putative ATP-dependent protease|nr:AAA family ATPase [Clostridiales bacterium]